MASLLQELVDEVIVQLDDPIFTAANVRTGERERESNNDYPRIVFKYSGGPISDPTRVGGQFIDPNTKARAIGVRHVSVTIEIHGQSDEQCEQILSNVFRAVRNTTHASFEYGEESWPDQEDGADSFDKRGSLVVMVLTFQSPLYDTNRPLTLVTGFNETETFNGEVIDCTE